MILQATQSKQSLSKEESVNGRFADVTKQETPPCGLGRTPQHLVEGDALVLHSLKGVRIRIPKSSQPLLENPTFRTGTGGRIVAYELSLVVVARMRG